MQETGTGHEFASPQDYLGFHVDLDNPDVVAAGDELSLWSASLGLLLLEHVPLARNIAILDLGCGTGFPAIELAQRAGPTSSVVGLDTWKAGLERARFKARTWQVKNVAFVTGDATALPFAGGQFDLVVSNLGLNNFADRDAVLTECRRVMKPAAKLVLTTVVQGHLLEFYTAFESTLRSLDRGAELDALRKHIDLRPTIEAIGALLARHGLRKIKVWETVRWMRFVDGSAFLRHHFIKRAFLDAWKALISSEQRSQVFQLLEANLNDWAQAHDGLMVRVPMVYVEGATEAPQ